MADSGRQEPRRRGGRSLFVRRLSLLVALFGGLYLLGLVLDHYGMLPEWAQTGGEGAALGGRALIGW